VSSVLSSQPGRTPAARLDLAWLVALSGFAVMFVPIYWGAAQGMWQSEEQGHGAIVLAVMVWLFWTLRHEIDNAPVQPLPMLGWPIFGFGLLIYFVGRVFNITILEFAAQPFVVAGVLLLLRGMSAIRLAWFPLIYFIFMIPLPGMLVDAITGSLKGLIATIVESLLYLVGYPIARSGVILSIGPYQLQVADACSGLHSMFSLSALGTLFMYLMGHKSKLHMGIMLASILPIAFVANIIRVITLVLVTYYLGDEAGQGFLHGAAGMVLMLVALAFFFVLDMVLDKVLPAAPRVGAARAPEPPKETPAAP
jgi:exosortase B